MGELAHWHGVEPSVRAPRFTFAHSLGLTFLGVAALGAVLTFLYCGKIITGAFLDGLGEGPALPSLGAVAVSESVAILVSDGVYVGWRALDPLLAVRPMGWPELRQSEGPRREHDDGPGVAIRYVPRRLGYEWRF